MTHRNEPARARHRLELEKKYSLTSVQLFEGKERVLSLTNNFGWKIRGKCKVADGEFPPYLLACMRCDKPEIQTTDADKETYVLYIRGGGGESDTKEIQTESSCSLDKIGAASAPPLRSEESSKPNIDSLNKEKFAVRPFKAKHKRKKMIGDFYYIPIKQRIIAPQKKRRKSTRHSVANIDGLNSKDGSNTEFTDKNERELEISDKVGQRRKSSHARTKPKRWQLRAGADEGSFISVADNSEFLKKPPNQCANSVSLNNYNGGSKFNPNDSNNSDNVPRKVQFQSLKRIYKQLEELIGKLFV